MEVELGKISNMESATKLSSVHNNKYSFEQALTCTPSSKKFVSSYRKVNRNRYVPTVTSSSVGRQLLSNDKSVKKISRNTQFLREGQARNTVDNSTLATSNNMPALDTPKGVPPPVTRNTTKAKSSLHKSFLIDPDGTKTLQLQ